jgi:ABC-type Fe3+-siderophore transport system permease subunit
LGNLPQSRWQDVSIVRLMPCHASIAGITAFVTSRKPSRGDRAAEASGVSARTRLTIAYAAAVVAGRHEAGDGDLAATVNQPLAEQGLSAPC